MRGKAIREGWKGVPHAREREGGKPEEEGEREGMSERIYLYIFVTGEMAGFPRSGNLALTLPSFGRIDELLSRDGSIRRHVARCPTHATRAAREASEARRMAQVNLTVSMIDD